MKKRKKKTNGQAWWRSLSAEEQTNYRCELMEREGKIPNWDEEYAKVLKENNYMK